MNFKNIIQLLQEFDYEKNGVNLTIEFLEYIVDNLKGETNVKDN